MCVSDERRPMVMVSVPIVNFRLMIDNVSRAEAKTRAEGHPARAPNDGGHGLDVKDATKQEAVLDRRQSVWSEKLQPFDYFFRRLKSYRGLRRCTEVGNTHFQEEVGVVVSLSILRPYTKPSRACEVKVRPIFLTRRSSSVSGLSGVLRLLLRSANLTNGSSHSTWCSGGVRG